MVKPDKGNLVVSEIAHENISDVSTGVHEAGVLEPEVYEQDVFADEKSRHAPGASRDQFMIGRADQMHQMHEAVHPLTPGLRDHKRRQRIAILLYHLAHRFPNIRGQAVGALVLQVSFRCFREKDLALTVDNRHRGIMKSVPEPNVEFLHDPDRMRNGFGGRYEYLRAT